ncbi:MAG: MBL fold metallo-hydrolase [Armatimonadota bacterium]
MTSAETTQSSPLQATFLGAAETVTGSCTLVKIEAGSFLVDCGLYQGEHEPDQLKRLLFAPRRLEAVVLTHAHMDHSGLLPWLCAHGFAGPIFATSGTRDLCQIMLADSAKLQEEEAAYRARKGGKATVPLYRQSDVDATMSRFVAIEYQWPFEALPGATVEFHDAGHILGAASVRLSVADREVVFSGDIGPRGRPIVRDPLPPSHARTVITEATYGDRTHPGEDNAVEQLAEAVGRVSERQGVAIIPVFAVGRSQVIIYHLGELMRGGQLPDMPIFLDSPLAIEAMAVFQRHTEYFDQDTKVLYSQGVDPLSPPTLHYCRTVEDSKALNDLAGPAVILAGSGMCTGGRVRHHLRQRLGRDRDAVIFVGYQAQGTLGRILSDGVESVRLYGDWIPVRAEIVTIHGFSAHADQRGLLEWLQAIEGVEQVIINHAEEQPGKAYSDLVSRWTGAAPQIAQQFTTHDL